jgi:hypothetical protein
MSVNFTHRSAAVTESAASCAASPTCSAALPTLSAASVMAASLAISDPPIWVKAQMPTISATSMSSAISQVPPPERRSSVTTVVWVCVSPSGSRTLVMRSSTIDLSSCCDDRETPPVRGKFPEDRRYIP